MSIIVKQFDEWDPYSEERFVITPRMECRFGIEKDHDSRYLNILSNRRDYSQCDYSNCEYCRHNSEEWHHYVRMYFDTNNERHNLFLKKCIEYSNYMAGQHTGALKLSNISIIQYDNSNRSKSEPYLLSKLSIRDDNNCATNIFSEKNERVPIYWNHLYSNKLIIRACLDLCYLPYPLSIHIMRHYPKINTALKQELIDTVNDITYRPYGIGYFQALTEFNLMRT